MKTHTARFFFAGSALRSVLSALFAVAGIALAGCGANEESMAQTQAAATSSPTFVVGSRTTVFKISTADSASLTLGKQKCALYANSRVPLKNAPQDAAGGHKRVTLSKAIEGCSFTTGYIYAAHGTFTGVAAGGGSGASGGSAISGSPVAAYLSTIGYSEGTNDSYNIIFGGSTFSSYAAHPNRVICAGICSSAAGRYQFLNTTWASVQRVLGLPNFGPASQDEGAKYLMRGRGFSNYGQTLDRTSFAESIYKLAPEWASFPTRSGGSYYGGQSARSLSQLWSKYQSRL